MSALVVIGCTECDFTTGLLSNGELFVTLDSGEEAICWHPGEDRRMFEYTGMSFSQLRAANRIRYKEAYLCVSCGHTDYYERGQIKPYSSLCAVCHNPSVLPPGFIDYQDGCSMTLFNIGKRKFLCPICKSGELKTKAVYIT